MDLEDDQPCDTLPGSAPHQLCCRLATKMILERCTSEYFSSSNPFHQICFCRYEKEGAQKSCDRKWKHVSIRLSPLYARGWRMRHRGLFREIGAHFEVFSEIGVVHVCTPGVGCALHTRKIHRQSLPRGEAAETRLAVALFLCPNPSFVSACASVSLPSPSSSTSPCPSLATSFTKILNPFVGFSFCFGKENKSLSRDPYVRTIFDRA